MNNLGYIKVFLLLFILAVFYGCMSVPPGEPPEKIVEPPKATELFDNEAIAVNYMVTSLSTECLPLANSSSPPVVLEVKYKNPGYKKIIDKICLEILKMKLIKPVLLTSKDAKYVLVIEAGKLVANEKNETISELLSVLYSSGKRNVLWSRKIYFKPGK